MVVFMNGYPKASVVSRALRRDAGIITTPRDRQGYHVSGDGTYPAGIFVDLSDLDVEFPRENVRAAADLHDHLTAAGWTLGPISSRNPTSIYVLKVPTKAERGI
ncbi:hypothetical protein SEA_MINDY_8 [Mycobacterium phage Mindy]|uniref:Uncharacterized protein n=5 Tax=Kostyavirus TaxID=1623284 RepID=G1DHU4_9CAUD|nr:hypothetical protein Kostya_8 [Mycobacterium phage Kostya]YP_008409401.1 hypothetical protein DRDREY_8 [Mycobacterium phage DrDrey]YP_009197676.1 hypothetical protein SEA_NELITZAMV_8 [Mycobacterium phage NelitzaMV]YP_009208416.1 hypothetical protein SEA_TOTO_8 [Mycobacterium phage Toto]YP_009225295.1 hypothetical protein SEA_MINDY_8 [Mycobacterium phage Mindy]AEK08859.1 hypothetical protein PBI_HENRY_8 [Mycobacterium phage Henry]AGR48847.1 hypothetical protein PBI_ABCAT_7 [Mycobacterium ph